MTADYPLSQQNKVRQLQDKAVYERDVVHATLDSALVASVGFVEDGRAVVVPMIYGREAETLFLHGARKARVIRMLAQSRHLCINVTQVDGIVFARSAFNSSMNYRSATVFGSARLLEGADEKIHALRVISEHTMPGRWDELRDPLDREVKMTGVIAVNIETASAKVSAGMPDDEDEDYAIPVWAGVLPVRTSFAQAEDDDRLADGIKPSAVVCALEGKLL